MDVWKVRMLMHHGGVTMPMAVRFGDIPDEIVRMLMVFIMDMPVAVFQRFMAVFMFMALGEMQPDAPAHQAGGKPECR